jgi:dTDP-4-amino-4,6-dideoxygalactose transaminase
VQTTITPPNRQPPAAAAMRVPLLDLEPQTRLVRDGFLADAALLCDTGAFTNGPVVKAFEAAFAAWVGTPQCVGVASGLDALRLGLLAADLEPGSEVIVPANTFVATVEAISQAGLTPRLVDADEADYTINTEACAAAVTTRTAAVMVVHLYGQMADMRRVGALTSRAGIRLFEDACQAHGATRDGLHAGATSDAAAFSFYPGKNLGAFGDAGALVTGSEAIADRVRALREHGQHAKYQHDYQGYTARLDALQAAVLLRKLAFVDQWTAQRRHAAGYYQQALAGVGDLVLPRVAEGSQPVWHLYVVRTADPDRLCRVLAERGVATGRHYPVAVHMTGAYRQLGYQQGSFPVAERLAREVVSLPLYPGISDAQLELVVTAVRSVFS